MKEPDSRLIPFLGVLLVTCIVTGCRPAVAPPVSDEPHFDPISSADHETTADPLAPIMQSMEAGEFASAEAKLRPLLASDPENPKLLFVIATCRKELDDLDGAIELLSMIPEMHPDAGLAAMGQRADWLVEARRLAEAEAAYLRLLSVHGDLAPAHRRLVTILNSQGRRVESAIHARRLVEIGDVTEKELLSLSTLNVPFHDEENTAGSQDREHKLAEAKRLFVQEKTSEALAAAESLRDQEPQATAVVAFLGRVYDKLQRDDRLAEWASSLPPNIEAEPEYWAAVGNWMLRSGEVERAVRCLCEAIARDPTDRESHLRLAQALAMAGREDLARRVTDRHEKLHQAWLLSLNIGFERATRLDDIDKLATLLDQLDRPWESVAWRFIAAQERGELASVMPQLQRRRAELAAATGNDAAGREARWLCGIDKTKWPLPDLGSLARTDSSPVREAAITQEQRSAADIRLVNVAKEVELNFEFKNNRLENPEHFLMYQLAGGGIGVLDFDRDGWPDIYFCQAGGRENDLTDSYPNKLFRNMEGERFVDLGSLSGSDDRSYGQGVCVADVNQDGFPDIAVANVGLNLIYTNQGDGTFSKQVITGSDAWTTSIAMGDLDGDHLPEMVEVNYIDDPQAFVAKCWGEGFDCSPRSFSPGRDRVLEQDDAGRWNPSYLDGAFASTPSFGFAAIIANFDSLHGNDLFIANDTRSNHLWMSSTNASTQRYTLANESLLRGCAVGANGHEQGCMGIAAGDFNADGRLDLFVTNYWNEPGNLYLQRTPGFFSDSAAQLKLAEPTRQTVGFGAQATDLDRDGALDLVMLNGHVFNPADNGTPEIPFRMTPQCFRHTKHGFVECKTVTSHDPYWSTATLGRALARIDYNRDGKQDLIANHLDAPAALLENQTEGGHWLRLELVGVTSERDAVGATITARSKDRQWTAWVVGGHGYLCSNETTVDIGVDKLQTIETLEVNWPAGTVQTFRNVETNQTYLVIESSQQLYVERFEESPREGHKPNR